MKTRVKGIFYLIISILVMILILNNSRTSGNAQEKKEKEPSKLLVVWTSGDKEVAINMVYMYTYNAKKNGWWNDVRFLIWGPSSKLLSEDSELQDYLRKMKDAGVELFACKACADIYGVSDKLEELGVNVKYMGVPLTEMVKTNWVTMTF